VSVSVVGVTVNPVQVVMCDTTPVNDTPASVVVIPVVPASNPVGVSLYV
jgi:hypothetical protein